MTTIRPPRRRGDAAARLARDAELGHNARPSLRLSDVRRLQRRARPFGLLIMMVWVASVFAMIVLVRPLMVTRSDWYVLLIVLYLIPSVGLMNYVMVRMQRWMGLFCPYCGTAFIHSELKDKEKDSAAAAENLRRCSRCQSIMIDLEA